MRVVKRVAPLCFLVVLALLAVGRAALASELELIERLPGPIDEHEIVMLDGGRAMVAWERDDSRTDETVWTSLRDATGRWSVPEVVEFSRGHASGVQIAADDLGIVTVMWIQQELGLSGLWTNRYIPGEGWRDPMRVEPVAGEMYAPHLVIDASGAGFALWERRRGDRLGIRASRYTPDHGWETPRDIDAGEADATSPRLAVHARDHAMAVWSERDDSGNRRVAAARFAGKEGWMRSESISAGGADAYDAHLAMDAAGNTVVAWEQEVHGEESIFARRFQVDAGWSVPVQLEIDEQEGYGPRAVMSADGSAMVAWVRADGEAGTVVAARYTRESGWEHPVTVQGGELLYLFDLHIAGNSRGDVLATWCQTDGARNNIWYARFEPDSGWQLPALAEKRSGSVHRPRAAAGVSGDFGLLWKTVDAPLPEQALYSLWFRLVP